MLFSTWNLYRIADTNVHYKIANVDVGQVPLKKEGPKTHHFPQLNVCDFVEEVPRGIIYIYIYTYLIIYHKSYIHIYIYTYTYTDTEYPLIPGLFTKKPSAQAKPDASASFHAWLEGMDRNSQREKPQTCAEAEGNQPMCCNCEGSLSLSVTTRIYTDILICIYIERERDTCIYIFICFIKIYTLAGC